MTLQLPDPVRNSLPHGDRTWRIVVPIQCALVRMLEGTSDREDDLWIVAMAINLTWARCQVIGDGQAGQRLCEAAGQVLSACADKGGAPTLVPFTREQKQDVISALALYVDIVRTSSPLQLEQAQKKIEAMTRAHNRKARRA
jgi:hypothetical protein